MIDEQLKFHRATDKDLLIISELAIKLGQQHVGYDRQRFNFESFAPIEKSYRDFFSEQLQNERAVILLAELNKTIVGYAFIRIEQKHFGDLLDAGAWLHDIYFEENIRGRGIGKQFFEEIIKVAKNLGSGSLMLMVSPHNTNARKFFEHCGFRPTMQEMRIDFENKE